MFETYNLKVFGCKGGIKYNAVKPKKPPTDGESILHDH